MEAVKVSVIICTVASEEERRPSRLTMVLDACALQEVNGKGMREGQQRFSEPVRSGSWSIVCTKLGAGRNR